MRSFILVLAVACLAGPVAAQGAEEAEGGRDLMGEAMRLFMKGLMQEMEPALEDLSDLLDQVDAYHPPEVLPNGDIIIRRKTPAAPDAEVDPDGEIEL